MSLFEPFAASASKLSPTMAIGFVKNAAIKKGIQAYPTHRHSRNHSLSYALIHPMNFSLARICARCGRKILDTKMYVMRSR